jgi:hypothetical protein
VRQALLNLKHGGIKMRRKLLGIIAVLTLTAVISHAVIVAVSEDFDTSAGTNGWHSVGPTNTVIAYDSTSVEDYDDGDPANKLAYTVGMLLTGDGVKDDGGLRFNTQNTSTQDEAIGLDISGTMELGEVITFSGNCYNDNSSFHKFIAQLWNRTDNVLLAQSVSTTVKGKNDVTYVPQDFSVSYTVTPFDAGKMLQVRILEDSAGNLNRDPYLDNFSLTSTGGLLVDDDFSTGSGVGSGSAAIANGWESVGPEEKVYNTTNSLGTDFTGKLGWSETGAGSFDSIATAFSAHTLSDIGDFITVSFDYLTTSTDDNSTGLRVRLYEQGTSLSVGGRGYGVNMPSGPNTGSISYRSYVTGNPFATTDGEGNTGVSGPLGDGDFTVVLTVTKTAASEITLSGSYGTNVFSSSVMSTNLFTFDAFGISVGSLTQGLEIDNVRISHKLPFSPPDIYLLDDFESGSASTSNGDLANGWSADSSSWASGTPGPENKEYNVSSSGILDMRDAILASAAEEGAAAQPHKGYFENLHIRFQDLPLTNNGDWLELSVDMAWYEDTSGASITNTVDPLANLTLVDSSKTNNAGYGFRVKNGQFHQLTIHDHPTDFPTQVPGSVTSREQSATNGILQTWTMRIERSGSDFLISPTINGVAFGPSGGLVETFTNNACIDAVFDQLTFTVRGNDVGMKIDNVSLVSNVELVIFSAYEQWAFDNGLSGAEAEPDQNPDSDALDNHGEYVFGGNPKDENDIGIQPVFESTSGDYIYVLRNDDSLSASVLTRPDLVMGNWTTNSPEDVTLNDGGLASYTNSVGTASDQMFIKLLVE